MKIALSGYGRMGKEIESVLLSRGHQAVLIIDIDNRHELNAKTLREVEAEVVIDFSTPETAFDNIKTCIEAGVPVVCGTTGWLDRYEEAVHLCHAHGGAFFYASNYSPGVNILFAVNERLAQLMEGFPDYDVTVEEVHHTGKKDAPSGTAITLAEDIIDHISRKNSWHGGVTTEPGELEVTSVRRSIVPGTHTVTYESDIDTIMLSHNAKNRKGFAVGAVMAAEFIQTRKGVYSMRDLLGI